MKTSTYQKTTLREQVESHAVRGVYVPYNLEWIKMIMGCVKYSHQEIRKRRPRLSRDLNRHSTREVVQVAIRQVKKVFALINHHLKLPVQSQQNDYNEKCPHHM